MDATTRNTCLIVGGAACGCLLLGRMISRIIDRTLQIAARAALPTAVILLAYDQFDKYVRERQRFAPFRLQPFAIAHTAYERVRAIRRELVPGLRLDLNLRSLPSDELVVAPGVQIFLNDLPADPAELDRQALKAVVSLEWFKQLADALSHDARLNGVRAHGTLSASLASEQPIQTRFRIDGSVAHVSQTLPASIHCTSAEVDDLSIALAVSCEVNLATHKLNRSSAKLVPAPR